MADRVPRTREALEARFTEYCRLRDEGTDRTEAAARVGVGDDAGSHYERAWKRSRNIPLGQRWSMPGGQR